mmetsp:Transcript_57068/g.156705  ORF Transcript_57068/g.156705 Transcript_57068/m.156705 type:complete len:302 (+) Transcript_57068:188-1093(+)
MPAPLAPPAPPIHPSLCGGGARRAQPPPHSPCRPTHASADMSTRRARAPAQAASRRGALLPRRNPPRKLCRRFLRPGSALGSLRLGLIFLLLVVVLLLIVVLRLAHAERQLVLLVASQVRVAHQVECVVVLARLRRHKVELHLGLEHEGDALDAEQRVRLGVSDDEPPALLLVLGIVRRKHLGHARLVVALALQRHHDAHRLARRDLVGVLHLKRHVDVGVAVGRVGDVDELALRHVEEGVAVVVLHVHQVEDGLDAGRGRLLGHVLGHVRQLKEHRVALPHGLDAHLRDLHRGEGGREPA